eukprot:1099525-Pyramimonas_sp.AAC.1
MHAVHAGLSSDRPRSRSSNGHCGGGITAPGTAPKGTVACIRALPQQLGMEKRCLISIAAAIAADSRTIRDAPAAGAVSLSER